MNIKKLFAALLLSTCAMTAFSQEKGTFEIGLIGGLNLATAQSGSLTNSSSKLAFNAGVSGDYYFSEKWSLRGKLTYDQKGWNKGYITANDKIYQTDYTYSYLTIPVMGNFHFGKTKNWNLNLGPYAGFLLSAKESALHTDLKSFSNSFDAGMAFGLGVKIPVADKIKILLETELQTGFLDIIKNNQGTAIKNSRGAFNAGLIFAL